MGHIFKVDLGVVQFSVQVSQSFQWKDLGGWVGFKNLSDENKCLYYTLIEIIVTM